MSLRILDPGALTLIQDLGRPDRAASGVTASGAADARSLRLANQMAGNSPEAPALETLLGGLRLRAERDLTMALAGAPAPIMRTRNVPNLDEGPVLHLRAGEEVALGSPAWGMRTYLAVTGGVLAETVMGSASTDTLSGLGPAPLSAGAVVQVRTGHAAPLATLDPGQEAWHGPPYMFDVLPGPRAGWFTDEARTALLTTPFSVTGSSDRIGTRLSGARLERSRTDELASEGVVRGAIQVPADGQPLIFGPDHPVTGGYPVIGVLTQDAADASGQLRPGQQIRFRRRGSWH